MYISAAIVILPNYKMPIGNRAQINLALKPLNAQSKMILCPSDAIAGISPP
jgi:hypothetical protein